MLPVPINQQPVSPFQRRSLRLKEQTEARAERARLDRQRARQREEQLVARFAGPTSPS